MQGNHKDGKTIITLKLEPSHGQLPREEYSDIIPGYYMNKEHGNSVYLDSAVPDDLLQDMIEESHELILTSLSKKARQQILAENQFYRLSFIRKYKTWWLWPVGH